MPDVKLSFDCLRVERALSGLVSPDDLSPRELDVFRARKAGFEIGRLASRLAQGYYAYIVALEVARDSRSIDLFQNTLPGIDGKPVSIGYVTRRDGTTHTFDAHYYLNYLSNPEIRDDFDRTWLVGALLTVGDALQQHGYFDHAPILELLYHLRNGIAHGNRFNLMKNGLARLDKYPAHNRQASVKTAEFEIVKTLNGKSIFFDFMGPADVLDLLFSIEVYLTRVCGNIVVQQN